MKKIRQWVDHLSVKKKLIFYGYLTITPVLIVICLVLLVNNYHKVQDEKLKNDTASVDTLAESLGILQTDIKDFSTYICINNDIHALLTTEDVEEKNKNAKLWLEEAPMAIVQDMMALKGHIKTIAIYPENGIRPYLRCMDGSAYIDDLEVVHSTDIYGETLASKNGMVWKSVPKGSGDTYLTNRSDKIVLYREIFDLTQKKTLGYIAIGVSQEYFQNLCQNITKNEKESVLILDKNGGELVKTGTLPEKLEDYLTGEDFIQQNYKEREKHFTYGDHEVICTQTDKNSSIVCKVVPAYGLQMQVLDIAYMPLILLIGMLIGLMPLLMIISNLVTKPLRRLCEAINEFSTGDFEQQVEVMTHDEVGEVAECFNQMVYAIKELIDENYVITLAEKESELAALQAQINPHFLYNTLDSLYWQAMNADNEEIAESILALSQLFRLVLSQGKREVTVGQETELVSRYLQIQKMRFSKRLEYQIDVEDSVKKAKIPKLILQPFVENAIVHGFENVSTPCELTVSGIREGDNIRFEIRDTGIGMRQDQIDEIWEEEPDQYRKQRIGRYAIKNIRERLQRKYQDRFTLEIQSEVGKGTTVILIVPYEEE
ncbi:sensor histidine kinase [Blautia sp. MSJ-19]|uniref:sensor histidine kinase n=1 Tax=Blautia sp. MSJ-19 TaxID=2841517 RepID=UPI001C0ED87D|nr:sensor histidine kinase [Blautia sp. MSJ-19]MBU5480336.1 sensor histidine kinase [Blautia sp. MSJ-19]